jgi:hypothetical protein
MSCRKYITLFLLLLSFTGKAQYLVGLQAGVNELLQRQHVDNVSYEGKNFVGYVYPAFTVTVMTDLGGRCNIGLSAQYLLRSFYYESYVYDPPHVNHFITDHDSRYLYLGVAGDVALDKKKYFHCTLTPALGFFTGGKETWYNGEYFASGVMPFPKDSLHTNSDHIAKTDFRLGTQLRLQVPVTARVSVCTSLQCNIGFTSVNDLHHLCPADLLFGFGVFYAVGTPHRKSLSGNNNRTDIPRSK